METCRACLQKNAEKYVSVFKKIHQITLDGMFHSLTGLSVSSGDGLPQCFCEECAYFIVTCNNFRKKCLKSDAHLRAVASNAVSEDLLYKIEECGNTSEEGYIDESENIVTEETYYEAEVQPTTKQLMQDIEESDYEVYSVLDDFEIEDNELFADNNDGALCEDIVEASNSIENSNISEEGNVEAAAKNEPPTSLVLSCCACTGLQFTSLKDLKQHGLEIHKTEISSTSSGSYNCDICYKRSCKNAQLAKQKPSPESKERYGCTECPASYRGRAALHSHMKSKHVGIRTYVCDVCQKAFHTSSTLLSHRQIHGEKKFQCNTCSKSFVRRHDLAIHQNTHSTERPYECTVCEMRFKLRSHLRDHQSVHTGERSKKCRICGEGFRTYSDRLVHEKQHENIDLFKCDHCGKKYGRNYKLQVHIRKVHTGEQPFECTDCSKRFFQRWKLMAHRRIDHGVV
ncbi:zinc finger protein 436-like [Anopheles moucheti]|uniref:zinc finger protein 436-like n=1 Tax=Anopheles moucheti TaxID=186751 RepID=UPI0022F0B357|nr:zinc finger protein 436-like [Anopheles moucheti]